MEEWTDRDGNNRTTLGVQATDMHFVSAGRSESGGEYSGGHPEDDHETHSGPPQSEPSPASSGSSSTASAPAADDDIPF